MILDAERRRGRVPVVGPHVDAESRSNEGVLQRIRGGKLLFPFRIPWRREQRVGVAADEPGIARALRRTNERRVLTVAEVTFRAHALDDGMRLLLAALA